MSKCNFKYIYGPVSSWRLGSSLGIDLISDKERVCSFDCAYCQLGRTKSRTINRTIKRKLYVPTEKIIREIKALPEAYIDYITFSGRGEPTLAINLGESIKAVRKLRKEPIAVLTNASLMDRKDVREELSFADIVAVKLDAHSERMLKLVNRPAYRIRFSNILKGIMQFRKKYRGVLAVQIMFIKKNKDAAQKIAEICRDIQPDEIQINTPKRKSPVRPLSQKTIFELKKYFRPMKVVSVYDVKGKKVKPLSAKSTLKRRGKTP